MIDPHSIEKEVLEFFFVFSRFEFALKESGYISGKEDENALPNWGAFVKKYKDVYKSTKEIQDSVNHLLRKPPRKQKVINVLSEVPRTTWRTMEINENAPLLQTLVDIIKATRNNLFHGGKYGDKGWDDERRVSLLLRHSIIVIRHWLILEDDINVYFHDWA